jgi:hypothetical protein
MVAFWCFHPTNHKVGKPCDIVPNSHTITFDFWGDKGVFFNPSAQILF